MRILKGSKSFIYKWSIGRIWIKFTKVYKAAWYRISFAVFLDRYEFSIKFAINCYFFSLMYGRKDEKYIRERNRVFNQ